MRALMKSREAPGLRQVEVKKGDLLTPEELAVYLEGCDAKPQLELYSSASVLRVERHRRFTERFRLEALACGVRWKRVS